VLAARQEGHQDAENTPTRERVDMQAFHYSSARVWTREHGGGRTEDRQQRRNDEPRSQEAKPKNIRLALCREEGRSDAHALLLAM
jgi:hypothetical protein